jgi:hypothetical protein
MNDTISQGKPSTGLYDRPLCSASALDMFAVKTALLNWELGFIPIIHDSIEAAVTVSRANG